jgi:hypothetical protein
MARFIAVVKLSQTTVEDLAGSRQRFEQVRRYLARRGSGSTSPFGSTARTTQVAS